MFFLRIQQVDGGFFEKFGALFREYGTPANAANGADETGSTGLKGPMIDALLADKGDEIPDDIQNTIPIEIDKTEENDHETLKDENGDGTANGTSLDSSGESEPENELETSGQFIGDAVGWNVSIKKNIC